MRIMTKILIGPTYNADSTVIFSFDKYGFGNYLATPHQSFLETSSANANNSTFNKIQFTYMLQNATTGIRQMHLLETG